MKHEDANPALAYIRSLYAQEDSVLRNIRATFEQRGMAIQVGAEEGKLLHLLIKVHQPRYVVEIGTLGGYSAIWIARALPKNGHLHTIEQDAEHAELARQFIRQAGLSERITVWEGKALDVLPRVADTIPQWDAVFIDADKISYPKYLDWAESQLRPGGLLIADNTLLFGTVYHDAPPSEGNVRPSTWQAMRDFNARLANGEKFEAVQIATEEGFSIALRKEKMPVELM